MKWTGVLVLLGCMQNVLSDTEILNFSSQPHSTDSVPFIPTDWPILSRHNNSRTLTIKSTPWRYGACGSMEEHGGRVNLKNCINEGDLWLVMDLDTWFHVSLGDSEQDVPDLRERWFTVRLSWPGSTPVDMVVSPFPSIPDPKLTVKVLKQTQPAVPPQGEGIMYDLDQHRADERRLHENPQMTTSRRMIIRIRAVNPGRERPPNPDGAVFPFQFSFLPHWFLPAPLPPSDTTDPQSDYVRFQIILEPLIFGVLPETTLPGAVFLVILLLVVSIFGVALVNAALSRLANRARKGKGKFNN